MNTPKITSTDTPKIIMTLPTTVEPTPSQYTTNSFCQYFQSQSIREQSIQEHSECDDSLWNFSSTIADNPSLMKTESMMSILSMKSTIPSATPSATSSPQPPLPNKSPKEKPKTIPKETIVKPDLDMIEEAAQSEENSSYFEEDIDIPLNSLFSACI